MGSRNQPKKVWMTFKKKRLPAVILITAGFFLAVVIYGCGKKADPVPPETATRKAVSDLKGMITEGGITLRWSIPEPGIDVAGFKIYRSELKIDGNDCPGCPREYSIIADIPCRNGKLVREGEKKLSYLDTDVKIGYLYSYKVATCTSSGYCSSPSNAAEIINR